MALQGLHLVPAGNLLFSVYAGDGLYLSSATDFAISQGAKNGGMVRFGGLGEAARLDKRKALSACHAARAAGVPSWIIRHPASVAA